MRAENGFGSIVCLDKTGKKRRKPWAVRITTGWKDGKQVRKYLGYYKTQKEALVALAEYHRSGVDIDLTNVTLKELFDRWLVEQDKRNISYSAKRGHYIAYNRLGKLGDMPIAKIKAIHLQKWMDDIDLKPGTKNKIKTTIGQVYDHAVQNDIVNKNYAKFIKIEEKVEKTGAIFTDDEIKLLWKHSDDEIARIFLIMIYTGMRIGEVLSMSADNIHFDEFYMTGGSKTDAGKDRIIPIHKDLLPLIKMQLGDNKWLVQNSRGNSVHYANLSPQAHEYLGKLGMNHKFHDGRKTAVSLMHSAGIPMETIKIIIGHTGYDVTEKVYLYKNINELVDTINRVEVKK